MIKALELENFKAFGKRTRIEFAPITLIYGENSAGKSSILNALNLLKQTRMSRDQGALLLPRTEGGLVDLGSFHELLYDHDSSRTLSIRLDVSHSGLTRHLQRPADDEEQSLGLECGFRRDQDENDIGLAFLRVYLGDSTAPVVQFEPKELDPEQADSIRRYSAVAYRNRASRQISRTLRGAVCNDVTSDVNFWRHEYRRCLAQRDKLVAALSLLRDETRSDSTELAHHVRESLMPSAEALDEAIRFYSTEFSLEDFAKRRRAATIGAIVALDGFLPVAANPVFGAQFPELIAVRSSRPQAALRGLFFDASGLLTDCGFLLERALENLFPLGPYRRAPQRLYIFTGTTPLDVGYAGNLLPDLLFRKRGLVAETNSWLDKLDVGYHINISSVGTPSNDLFEVRLTDQRRPSNTSVALSDVGFGISQILPFIVQSLTSSGRTITIEQPEVHVHPRLQADLADLLIAGIQEGKENQFIVETHSEHLVLRMLRRIRETSSGDLPDGYPGLSPKQISILYLQRGSQGTELLQLRVDANGEFIDRWPHGFFEERARELF